MWIRLIEPPLESVFEYTHHTRPHQEACLFNVDDLGQLQPNHEWLSSLRDQYRFFLGNFSIEHWGGSKEFPFSMLAHDLLQQHFGNDFLCVSHDPGDEHLRPNIMYFPWHAHVHVGNRLDPAVLANSQRRYLFCCLNQAPRPHRVLNYLLMLEKPYKEKCLLTMCNQIVPTNGYHEGLELTPTEQQKWDSLRVRLPTRVMDGFGLSFHWQNPALHDTYVNVVAESCIRHRVFLTGKVWQCVAAGQLFVVWGNPYNVSELRRLGVDVFDDIIDHSYDEEMDHRSRLQKIHQELDRLSQQNFAKIYDDTLQRRCANAENFASGAIVRPFINKLRSRISRNS